MTKPYHSDSYLKVMFLHDDQFPIIREIRRTIPARWGGGNWWKIGELVRCRKEGHRRYTIRKMRLGKFPLPLTHIMANVPANSLLNIDKQICSGKIDRYGGTYFTKKKKRNQKK